MDLKEVTIKQKTKDLKSLRKAIQKAENYGIPIRAIVPEPNIVDIMVLDSQYRSQTNSLTSISGPYKFPHTFYKEKFNIALMIPTGIGCDLGGHAGDAGSFAKVLGGICDNLILHPNVVNASDINEMPTNALYIEGSIFSDLFLNKVGLIKSKGNRILVIIERHEDKAMEKWYINAVNAAAASYGLSAKIIFFGDDKNPLNMAAKFSNDGRATGEVENLKPIVRILNENKHLYDAVAIFTKTKIENQKEVVPNYLKKGGINPWGGIEAGLTHALSRLICKQVAHAPMLCDRSELELDLGVVDPRMAAECITLTYSNCLLKGLMNAPMLTDSEDHMAISLKDISCLVMPDKCVGIPTLSAIENNIPIVAIRENINIMKNVLLKLNNIHNKKIYIVDNHWEAIGVVQCIKEGINPSSVRRPLDKVDVLKGGLHGQGK